MLQAMNTGHDGSLCTVHANSPRDALVRLETLALFAGTGLAPGAVRRQIVSAIDLVVFVTRAPAGRYVTEVAEVLAAPADELAVRTLLARVDGELRAVASPARAARRPGCADQDRAGSKGAP